MKVAFCLHGISSGINFKEGGLPVTFNSESELFHKHIINNNDTDVFYHTWDSEYSLELEETYKPKSCKVEPLKTFKAPTFIEKIKHVINKLKGINELYRVNNLHSRWYSFYESIKLVTDYEKKTGVKYDYIFATRFDMSLFVDIVFEKFDKTKFYCGDWYTFYDKLGNEIDEKNLFNNKQKVDKKVEGYPNNDRGISDFWFFSQRETMVNFSEIYLDIDKLIKTAGKSNHLIALEKIRSINMEDKITKHLEFGKDYYLTRWIKS